MSNCLLHCLQRIHLGTWIISSFCFFASFRCFLGCGLSFSSSSSFINGRLTSIRSRISVLNSGEVEIVLSMTLRKVFSEASEIASSRGSGAIVGMVIFLS